MDIGFFFHQEWGKGYVISRAMSRRIIPADEEKFRGDPAERRFYDVEPVAEGIENPLMVPFILKMVNRDEKMNPPGHGRPELLCLLEGNLLSILGEERIILKKGDAVYFDGNVPDKAIRLNKKPAKVLSIHMDSRQKR